MRSASTAACCVIVVLAAALRSDDANADGAYPVSVEVVGQGKPVRVLVTSRVLSNRGQTISYSNCDDGRDVSLLLWRVVSPGETFAFTSRRRCVCYQQGYGSFRGVDLLYGQDRCADANGHVRVVVDTNL